MCFLEHSLVDREWAGARHEPVRVDRRPVLIELEFAFEDGPAAEQGFVQVLDVGEVEKVVGDQLVVSVHLDGPADEGEGRIGVEREVRNLRLLGERRLAHPDPHQSVSFSEREDRNGHA